MSQAEDLLNSLSENDISDKTEHHIVVDSNRVITVPSELKRIAVQYDHNIETVTFDCPRYWDDHDMSTMNVYINYTRADNEPGCYIADDVAVDETDTSIMHFSWTISRHVTEAVGPLTILICIKMVDADGNEVNHWNSERNTDMTISKGMECGDIIVDKYPDVITYLRADMGNLADLTTEDKSSLVAAINEAAESGGSKDAVTYTPQTLTDKQKSQARTNIGAYTKPADGIPKSDLEQSVQTSLDKADTAISLGLTAATPGQIIKVKTVQDGKPTEWETADIYEKPDTGIPKSDLADDVQTSLDKADTAILYNSQTLTTEQQKQARANIGVGQPDWNQNDSTQPDYVKNRPFYTGDPAEMVFVEESTVSFVNAGGMYMAELESTFSATVGETYKVSWDGTVYECVCAVFNSYPVIGNLSIAGAGSDTGEPFLILVANGRGIEIYTADTSASHTLSISGFVPQVVKIDAKYLPEYSVFYSDDPANWSNAKKQQMYDDFISGKLVLYRYDNDSIGVVLCVFYSRYVGLNFVFFENYHSLRSFHGNALSNPIELSESGINNLIHDYINTLKMWKLYGASASEVSVGDLLSMYVAFDSTTNKACILTNTKGDIGSIQLKSTIVTNGDADITLSSSTAGSTKKFKITVDDLGVITATEVT